MCGIAGIFNYSDQNKLVDRDTLVRMTRALIHRGPDDEGIHLSGPVGLGHRRLSIVDLSSTGRQPMANADGSRWLTYNGEFYNHAEFRSTLESKGYRFRGTSDTETLLYLLEEEGPDALEDVAGIFGFAYWDATKRCLTLARDPLGVKQLYYHDDGRRLVFASEIKALLQCADVPREIDPEGVNQYLHFHTSLFDRTFFRGIKQLRAGEYMQVTRNSCRIRKYWSVQDFSPLDGSPEQLVEQLRAELNAVVGQQLMSDVPIGSFFSGGIDSSAIAAYATRLGKRPQCFGVHFADQGVIDERPYQEATAKALDVDLELITLDGSNFREDLFHSLYHQDQPVIGAAMFPMGYVSRLAARKVKVCLGGQGADELFGGYARYALARPAHVIASWFAGRGVIVGERNSNRVSGNLGKQFRDVRTFRRLAKNATRVLDWEGRYFENFAKVPESTWGQIFMSRDFFDRERCRQVFHDQVQASPAIDPADKAMHWDMQTYLTGLFHQDDRMSMSASLESRVPIADPRLVKFAFRIKFDSKFRGGASKWILRQAVSDVLPEIVLNRRKVGFDTPAQSWMMGPQKDFVRDILLSRQARERGLWNAKELEARLANVEAADWFDVFWKALCIEAWATIFLDAPPADQPDPLSYVVRSSNDPAALTSAEPCEPVKAALRDKLQEVRELGMQRTFARVKWELKLRTGAVQWSESEAKPKPSQLVTHESKRPMSIGANPINVANQLRGLMPNESLTNLQYLASEAGRGRILCFSKWFGEFGNPIDWHVNPRNGARWAADLHWSRVLRDEPRVGDVKLAWEAARFPQAFHFARAAAFFADHALEFAGSFFSQIEHFLLASRKGKGIHWNSSQEIVLRLIAWSFALEVFDALGVPVPSPLEQRIQTYIAECASHLGSHIEYARDSVYNNHLIAEALGLHFLGDYHPAVATGSRLGAEGLRLLTEQASVQFYNDGSYIMHSHNYHRGVLQMYLWAHACNRKAGRPTPDCILKALESSLDFLIAHQNPEDGRLPNFGANDGSLPLPLTSCDFADFRPTLQAVSIAARAERVYEPGPWDEMAAWLLGPGSLDLPLRRPVRRSISFSDSGHHILRSLDEKTFATFRCGDLLSRFSQIDMMHLDVWWKGQNVLVDGGSYLYNGPQKWHESFCRTGSHNTLQLDGNDQMLHLRRFKNIYNTKAKLLCFKDHSDWALCEGELYSYLRKPGKCIHRRSVLFIKDGLWVVIDSLRGEGSHNVRLHWLGGEFPFEVDENSVLRLATPEGLFTVSTFDDSARMLPASILVGEDDPIRGWMSRYYGEKVPVPSFVVDRRATLPSIMVSVLCGGTPRVEATDSEWSVASENSSVTFRIEDSHFLPQSVCVSSALVRS